MQVLRIFLCLTISIYLIPFTTMFSIQRVVDITISRPCSELSLSFLLIFNQSDKRRGYLRSHEPLLLFAVESLNDAGDVSEKVLLILLWIKPSDLASNRLSPWSCAFPHTTLIYYYTAVLWSDPYPDSFWWHAWASHLRLTRCSLQKHLALVA